MLTTAISSKPRSTFASPSKRALRLSGILGEFALFSWSSSFFLLARSLGVSFSWVSKLPDTIGYAAESISSWKIKREREREKMRNHRWSPADDFPLYRIWKDKYNPKWTGEAFHDSFYFLISNCLFYLHHSSPWRRVVVSEKAFLFLFLPFPFVWKQGSKKEFWGGLSVRESRFLGVPRRASRCERGCCVDIIAVSRFRSLLGWERNRNNISFRENSVQTTSLESVPLRCVYGSCTSSLSMWLNSIQRLMGVIFFLLLYRPVICYELGQRSTMARLWSHGWGTDMKMEDG